MVERKKRRKSESEAMVGAKFSTNALFNIYARTFLYMLRLQNRAVYQYLKTKLESNMKTFYSFNIFIFQLGNNKFFDNRQVQDIPTLCAFNLDIFKLILQCQEYALLLFLLVINFRVFSFLYPVCLTDQINISWIYLILIT